MPSIRSFFATTLNRLSDFTLNIGVVYCAATFITPIFDIKMELHPLMEKLGLYMVVLLVLLSVILSEASEHIKSPQANARGRNIDDIMTKRRPHE